MPGSVVSSPRVALFGGAFDPPHLGHQGIINYLLETDLVDEVWWVPTGQHPYQKPMTAAKHRLAMINLVLGANQRIEQWELEQDQSSLTYLTLRHFRETQPRTQFSWVIGSDNAEDFFRWEGALEMLDHHTVFVYPRVGFDLAAIPERLTPLLTAPLVKASSTQVRQLVQEGQSITALVDPRVADYIYQWQLYI